MTTTYPTEETTMTTIPNRSARLVPLDGAQYEAVTAWKRQNDPATCPCCDRSTTQGWLDDVGSCYDCSAAFDAEDATAARVAKRRADDGARLIVRSDRVFLTLDW